MPPRLAIIGAGLSGLIAGHTVAPRGVAVSVFDKGRGPGGRMSTRRHGDFAFDHGAQYFTVRDERFRRRVDAWIEAGLVQQWDGRVAVAEGGAVSLKDGGPERYVGMPRMSSIPGHLAESLDVQYQVRIGRIERDSLRWHLFDEEGLDLGAYDAVLVSVPPAQAVPLLAHAPPLAQQAGSVTMAPTWAVMATFDAPLPLGADGLFVHDAPLSWAARNGSKPGRPGHESWVLHGSAAWSRAHLEEAPGTIVDGLLAGFFDATGLDSVSPVFAQAHRWRYAQADDALKVGCLWDDAQRIGVCGDWCHGSRVEGAFLSGLEAADRILRTFGEAAS